MRGKKAKQLRKLALMLSEQKQNTLSRHSCGAELYTAYSPRRLYQHFKKTLRGKPLAALYDQQQASAS